MGDGHDPKRVLGTVVVFVDYPWGVAMVPGDGVRLLGNHSVVRPAPAEPFIDDVRTTGRRAAAPHAAAPWKQPKVCGTLERMRLDRKETQGERAADALRHRDQRPKCSPKGKQTTCKSWQPWGELNADWRVWRPRSYHRTMLVRGNRMNTCPCGMAGWAAVGEMPWMGRMVDSSGAECGTVTLFAENQERVSHVPGPK